MPVSISESADAHRAALSREHAPDRVPHDEPCFRLIAY